MNLDDKVTVIHLSDHGMSSIKEGNIIDLTRDLPLDTYFLAGSTPCLHIVPYAGTTDYLFHQCIVIHIIYIYSLRIQRQNI